MTDTTSDAFVYVRKNPKIQNIYDVELRRMSELKRYEAIECHLVLYPYSRKVNSHHLTFNPFEEYVRDVVGDHRSAYEPIRMQMDKVFGLLLGMIVAILHISIRGELSTLFLAEPLIGLIGAYIIGKELWGDIERMLIDLTKSWPISLRNPYYRYRLDRSAALTLYSNLAKKHRYGRTPLLPDMVDFVRHSNSQTLRMFFERKDIEACPDENAHIMSIHIDPAHAEELEKHGYMLGVKLSLHTKAAVGTHCYEMFQSLSNRQPGCLDAKGMWQDNAVFCRDTHCLGRIRACRGQQVLEGKRLLWID